MSTSFKKRDTQEVSRRSRAVTGKKKRRKKRDARANGFFAVLVAVAFIVAWLATGSILLTRVKFTTVEIHHIRFDYCANDLSFSSGIVMQAKFANRTLVSSHQKSWQNLGKKSPV